MKCGIIGLPNVGKSTIFNCLSNSKALAANYPFATIEPNVGVIEVPDSRVIILEKLVKPQKVQNAVVEIVDIAGLVKGASKGEGLGNKFLANIRETNAIIHVLRCFENNNISHIYESIDPLRDKETIDLELQIKDLETIDKRLDAVNKKVRIGDKSSIKENEVLKKYKLHIEKGFSARSLNIDKKEKFLINDLMLLTNKPVMYVCNVNESDAIKGNKYVDLVRKKIENENSELLIIAAETESDIMELDSFHERKEFLDDIGLKEPGLNKIIKSAYKLLNLRTFFTAGPKEVKAWTIKAGSNAPQAAGVIHSDFQKGFIRAEVIKYEDFIKYGTESACKDLGKLSIEGKDYIVDDGDIIHFRFNI